MGEIHTIGLGATNCYIVKCTEGYALIDTTLTSRFSEFIAKLNKININIKDIKYLVLTHHHDDHAGFGSQLKKETGCRVIVHRKAVKLLENGKNEETTRPLNFRIRLIFALFGGQNRDFTYPPLKIMDSDIVVEGEGIYSLRDVGIEGDIVYTPGHTKDSISLIMDDGKAFVGDAAMSFLKIAGTNYRPIFFEDQALVFKSWHKLIECGAKEIYPAHGNAFSAEELKKTMSKYCV